MKDNLFLGKVPQRMILGILDNMVFNGEKNKYPFAFQKKGVTSVRQFIEGEEYLTSPWSSTGPMTAKIGWGIIASWKPVGPWLNIASLW